MIGADQRVAIVTGAAQGIGAAVALRLAGDGFPVAVVDREGGACAATVDRIRGIGGRAVGVGADVAREDDVARAVERIAQELGPPAVLVNNAGFARDGLLADMTADAWDAVLGVHLRGSFLMTRAVQPFMAAATWGRIINISSISAQGHAGRVNYCAAKAGMHGFVKALAVELGPLGITANAIAPGLIVTAMTSASAARRGLSLKDHIEDQVSHIPVGRAGQPEDIAHTASFLASEGAGFVSGQVIYVAGGPHD